MSAADGGRLESNGEWLDYRQAQLKGGCEGCRAGQRKLLGPSAGLEVIMFLKHHRQGRTGALLGCCLKGRLWDRLGEASAWLSSQARQRVGNCSAGFAEERALRWRSVRLRRSAGLESLCRDRRRRQDSLVVLESSGSTVCLHFAYFWLLVMLS